MSGATDRAECEPMGRWVLVVAVSSSAGCGAGSCWSSAGIVDECKEGWTRGECAEWDDLEVNDATWTFSRRSCEALGFPVECADGSWVTSSGDC